LSVRGRVWVFSQTVIRGGCPHGFACSPGAKSTIRVIVVLLSGRTFVAAGEATPYAKHAQAAYPRSAAFLSPRSQPLPTPIPPDLFELRLRRELDLVLPLSPSLSLSLVVAQA
jgi:hypothetical protein